MSLLPPRPLTILGVVSSHDVAVVVYDGVQLLDVAGPVEVFDGATRATGGGYRVRVLSPGGRTVRAASGVRLGADADLADTALSPDTLVIAGGVGFSDAVGDPEVVGHVRRLAAGARRVASVCTGAFLLAEAGLLRGRSATTHWAYCAELARTYEDVTVLPDSIYVRDAPMLTAAGVTAGIDLALAMVEDDHGAEVARTVAKWLVVFLQRPGGQSQFSIWNQSRPVRDEALRELLGDIAAHPAGDLSITAMARRMSMSARHFSRLFTREVGTSPGRYVERARVEAARSLLEAGHRGVARRCGFGSAESMRRAFLRELGVPPAAYRDRFRTAS
ncbi:GlxA family transcriptional regulator [Saccharopolyspora erythraea]|uniref:GlxA family transcriptional regulator n=1 Tax=Saccharopolyspora erythraea TaxID=1836 RepID=UPI001BF1864E|nr:GlxA family transcriptional regulator [Saccharopolyspora erythraea]